MSKKLEDAIAEAGFQIFVNEDGDVSLEPSHLELSTIKIEFVRRGRYKTDPRYVPAELKEDNIFWIDEPPVSSVVTKSGEEIPVIFTQPETNIVIDQRVVYPDDN